MDHDIHILELGQRGIDHGVAGFRRWNPTPDECEIYDPRSYPQLASQAGVKRGMNHRLLAGNGINVQPVRIEALGMVAANANMPASAVRGCRNSSKCLSPCRAFA